MYFSFGTITADRYTITNYLHLLFNAVIFNKVEIIKDHQAL